MSRDERPLDPLSRFYGIDISDAGELRKLFSRKAEGRENWPAGADVVVSRALYLKYLRLYDLSCVLVKALGAVLDDAEHQLVMEEAEKLGYDLPDIQRFRSELETYKDFLMENDPGRVEETPTGRIRLSGDMADMLYQLTEYNCFMVSHIIEGCFHTDYMQHFGFLKRSGFHYAGATALQETLNVLTAMMHIKDQIDAETEFRDLMRSCQDNPKPPGP